MLTQPTLLEEIFFVIVLYKKRPEESEAISSLLPILKKSLKEFSLLIYDNSPQPSPIPYHNIIYRHDPKNHGVSKAYNEALPIALSCKKKWMLLLDQDTALNESFFRNLDSTTRQYPHSIVFVPTLKDRKGIVSPFLWTRGKGKRIDSVHARLALDKFRFVNSGALIETDSFSKAGGYDEKIPLDFSDIAFGENLRKITDHFVVVDSILQHAFSDSSSLTYNEAIERFSFFCLGALNMGRTFGPLSLYYFRALLRGLHLTIKFKRIAFIKTVFTS